MLLVAVMELNMVIGDSWKDVFQTFHVVITRTKKRKKVSKKDSKDSKEVSCRRCFFTKEENRSQGTNVLKNTVRFEIENHGRGVRLPAQLGEELLPTRFITIRVAIIFVPQRYKDQQPRANVFHQQYSNLKHHIIKVANDSMYATPLRSKAFYKENSGNITKLEVFLQVVILTISC